MLWRRGDDIPAVGLVVFLLWLPLLVPSSWQSAEIPGASDAEVHELERCEAALGSLGRTLEEFVPRVMLGEASVDSLVADFARVREQIDQAIILNLRIALAYRCGALSDADRSVVWGCKLKDLLGQLDLLRATEPPPPLQLLHGVIQSWHAEVSQWCASLVTAMQHTPAPPLNREALSISYSYWLLVQAAYSAGTTGAIRDALPDPEPGVWGEMLGRLDEEQKLHGQDLHSCLEHWERLIQDREAVPDALLYPSISSQLCGGPLRPGPGRTLYTQFQARYVPSEAEQQRMEMVQTREWSESSEGDDAGGEREVLLLGYAACKAGIIGRDLEASLMRALGLGLGQSQSPRSRKGSEGFLSELKGVLGMTSVPDRALFGLLSAVMLALELAASMRIAFEELRTGAMAEIRTTADELPLLGAPAQVSNQLLEGCFTLGRNLEVQAGHLERASYALQFSGVAAWVGEWVGRLAQEQSTLGAEIIRALDELGENGGTLRAHQVVIQESLARIGQIEASHRLLASCDRGKDAQVSDERS